MLFKYGVQHSKIWSFSRSASWFRRRNILFFPKYFAKNPFFRSCHISFHFNIHMVTKQKYFVKVAAWEHFYPTKKFKLQYFYFIFVTDVLFIVNLERTHILLSFSGRLWLDFLFKLGFTPCKAEQPLRGMALQEKGAH